MTRVIFFFLLTFLYGHTQCETDIIEKEGYYYEGCTNYEGLPSGNGYRKLDFEGQIQEFKGSFKNGKFLSGTLKVRFDNGDTSSYNYIDYPNEILSNETYISSNGDKLESVYNKGVKIKEIQTYGDGERKGLVVERTFSNNKITEFRNIDNNRFEEDIVGDTKYIDLDLIKEENKFRIPIEFPTTDGGSIKVPILFDTGATDFLIGDKLYQDLLENCEIVDLNVSGKIMGVGSVIETKYIKISEIKIGDYLVKNVVAIVPTSLDADGNKVNDMLIGIGFLKKFKDVEWSLNNDKLRFYK
ncbi:retroviral-like aspartic protease family protein [Flavobacteriaceae bacterium]|nr:retroviral-like aspartic protease family protein [Flavobacteriaceae bacterium]